MHGLSDLGWPPVYDWIHHQAEAAAHLLGAAPDFVAWAVTAFFDGILGLGWGLCLIPVAKFAVNPAIRKVTGARAAP